MKGFTRMDRSISWEFYILRMGVNMKESLRITRFLDMGSIRGRMEKFIKDSG